MPRLTRSLLPSAHVRAEGPTDGGLVEGDLLAGRYRLLSRLGAAGPGPARPSALWLARDEVLTRRVAVKALACEPGPDGGQAARFLAAARAAGAVGSPVLARVYDASVEQRYHGPEELLEPGSDVAYVIREWVDGVPLAQALEEDGPLPPATAVALTTAVAQSLTAAHALGLAHGRLHPGNVLLCRGQVRVTDLAVSAALPGGAAPGDRAGDGDPVADDVRDLAAVLYALLTGRWPVSATPQPRAGVPAAPVRAERRGARGRLREPRAVQRGVPPSVDAVVRQVLEPARAGSPPRPASAAELVDALQEAVAVPDRDGVRRAPRGDAVRRRSPPVRALTLLTGLGAAAFLAGSSVGSAVGTTGTGDSDRAGPASEPPGPADDSGAPSPAEPRVVPLATQDVVDFDPQGDGRERPEAVPAAVDGNPATAWTTERYATSAFGRLKEGVGLLVDLGAPTEVRAVELALSRPGVTVELRGASTREGSAAAYRLLAHGRGDGPALLLSAPEGTHERFLLLWITQLPRDGDRFAAGIAEITVRGEPDGGG